MAAEMVNAVESLTAPWVREWVRSTTDADALMELVRTLDALTQHHSAQRFAAERAIAEHKRREALSK